MAKHVAASEIDLRSTSVKRPHNADDVTKEEGPRTTADRRCIGSVTNNKSNGSQMSKKRACDATANAVTIALQPQAPSDLSPQESNDKFHIVSRAEMMLSLIHI